MSPSFRASNVHVGVSPSSFRGLSIISGLFHFQTCGQKVSPLSNKIAWKRAKETTTYCLWDSDVFPVSTVQPPFNCKHEHTHRITEPVFPNVLLLPLHLATFERPSMLLPATGATSLATILLPGPSARISDITVTPVQDGMSSASAIHTFLPPNYSSCVLHQFGTTAT